MESIKMICETCNNVYSLRKTDEIPEHVFLMRCNWCGECEDKAQDYYDEWWNEWENTPETMQTPYNPNQLVLPFANMSTITIAPNTTPIK